MKSTTAARYALVTTALLTAALSANLASAATPDDGPKQSVVNFSDLDLSQAKDAHRFYSRIKYAARKVCDNDPSSDLRLLKLYETCMAKAINDAVSQVQSVQVAEIHRADQRVSKN